MSLFDGMIDKAMGICNQTFGDTHIFYFKEAPEAAFEVDGIFDPEMSVYEGTSDFPVEVKKQVVGIRKSDFINAGHRLPDQGDCIRIAKDGVLYEVVRALSADDGWSEIRLVLMIKGEGTYA